MRRSEIKARAADLIKARIPAADVFAGPVATQVDVTKGTKIWVDVASSQALEPNASYTPIAHELAVDVYAAIDGIVDLTIDLVEDAIEDLELGGADVAYSAFTRSTVDPATAPTYHARAAWTVTI